MKRTSYWIGDDLRIEPREDGTVLVMVGSQDLATLSRDEALEAAAALLEPWADRGAYSEERMGIHPARQAQAIRRYVSLGATK